MATIYVSAAPILSPENTNVEDIRKSKTYHPSVWKKHFLSYTTDITEISADEKEEHQKQKEKVKNLLAQTPDNSTLKIEIINAIQRLGIAYHFEKEIEESLRKINDFYLTQITNDNDDLHVVALCFRLLRKQGYRVSCEVFKKFVDDDRNFNESLSNDVKGLLSLYEASYYGVNGEEILEKALEFSTSHLECVAHKIDNTSLLRQIKEALEVPISKTLIRLGGKRFISTYQEDESHNEELLNFAKLDFNILQKMHQEEAHNITRWWEELDCANKLPFARDRVVECYFWSLGVYFEPRYKTGRMFLSKIICMAAVFDDIYDVYGSLDELRRFTHAIERWDINAAHELPPYMRIAYDILLGIYADMEDQMAKLRDQSYRVQYAIRAMKELLKAYMKEAEWCYSKHVPTMDEYMKVALVSAGYKMVATTSLVGMGDAITPQDFDWITNNPPILQASSALARLMDDLAGHGKEQKIAAVSCYMNEHGCSDMEAFNEVSKEVKKAWKNLVEEGMEPRASSMEIIARFVNMCHVIDLLYATGDDGFSDSNSRTKQAIIDVLICPIN